MKTRNSSLALLCYFSFTEAYTTHPSNHKVNWLDYKSNFNKVVGEEPKVAGEGKDYKAAMSGSYRDHLLSVPHDEHYYTTSSTANNWKAYKKMIREHTFTSTQDTASKKDTPKYLKDHAELLKSTPLLPKSSLSSHHPVPTFAYSSWADYEKKLTKHSSKTDYVPSVKVVLHSESSTKPSETKTVTWNDYKHALDSFQLLHQHRVKRDSNWNSYKEQIGKVAKELLREHGYLTQEPASTIYHGPTKVEETSWGTYKHKYHLGEDTISLSKTPSLMEDEDELREIIQSTIAYEQEAKEEESPIQHVQKEAEVLLKAIKEAQSKTDPKDHFSNTSGFNH
uniref:Uncharacterized protein n=1 Tax=Ditylum brightwellii TaxID=49249 RepID=A0A7S4VYH3_9STRA